MDPTVRDGVILVESLRQRSDILLFGSLGGNIFGSDVSVEEESLWRKRQEVEIIPPSMPKFLITNSERIEFVFSTNELDTNI